MPIGFWQQRPWAGYWLLVLGLPLKILHAQVLVTVRRLPLGPPLPQNLIKACPLTPSSWLWEETVTIGAGAMLTAIL